MSIADVLVKKILPSLQQSDRHGSSFEDVLDDDLLLPNFGNEVPQIEVFKERDVDHGLELPEFSASVSVLGTYRYMSSPGLITLYQNNIESYWKAILLHSYKSYPFISRHDSKLVLELIVHSVYIHERFHYICDFCRKIFGGVPNALHEEALAVAFEWQWYCSLTSWNTISQRMHPTLRRLVVGCMFNHKSLGYRDWKDFYNKEDFYSAVTTYLNPSAVGLFSGTRFDFGLWAVNHVADDGNPGWEEQIVP